MDPERPSGLCFLLERQFRQVAFFDRVPLEDLAILYREAGLFRSMEEFLHPYVAHLRFVLVALDHCPAHVGQLTAEFPQVGRLLARRFG